MSGREEQLKRIIRDMLRPLRGVPLDVIIEAITNRYTIWPYDGHALGQLKEAARVAMAAINKDGILSRRPNEVGNYCEPFVTEAIRSTGASADKPMSASGRRKAAGYPDIEAEIEGKPFYIEVKTYNRDNADTTQRSFYLSPSADFKVTRNAYHLVFAFCMEETERKGNQRLYRTTGCSIIDVHNLSCDVKYEFNSDNRRLYGDKNLLIRHIDCSP